MDIDYATTLSAMIATSPAIVFAALGEMISERAGVLNLSLDGSLLISAMCAFAAALHSNSVIVGLVTGALVGAMIALVIAFASLTMKRSQVAVGFILALLCRDLAYLFGTPVANEIGPQVVHSTLPLLSELPTIGPILFDQDPMVYSSWLLIIVLSIFIYRTEPGLRLTGIGEEPLAAYQRGIHVIRLRYFYTFFGGLLIGLAGAIFSLHTKPGWSRPYGIEGIGWIILAIVIFGGWRPMRITLGVYLFVFLQVIASDMQQALPALPTQVFPTLPFPIMILSLLMVTFTQTDWVRKFLRLLPDPLSRLISKMLATLAVGPPRALGSNFERE
jgi:simple sugar transport system permease protein